MERKTFPQDMIGRAHEILHDRKKKYRERKREREAKTRCEQKNKAHMYNV